MKRFELDTHHRAVNNWPALVRGKIYVPQTKDMDNSEGT